MNIAGFAFFLIFLTGFALHLRDALRGDRQAWAGVLISGMVTALVGLAAF